MSTEVKIPAVGESITSGLISKWHKNDGDVVAAGDVLFTLETDKVSSEIVAETAGLLRIKVEEGKEVKIGELVATIEEAGAESGSGAPRAKTPKAVPAPVAEKPQARSAGKKSAGKKSGKGAPVEVEPQAAVLAPKPSGRIETPEPSQPSAVVDNLVETQQSAVSDLKVEGQGSPVAAVASGEGRTTRKKLSPLRRKIAAQLVMAQQTAAILTTFNECDMTEVMDLRSRMQAAFQKQYSVKLGFMSFFIKATVTALKAVPALNARMDGDDVILNHFFDIGVAVGTEKGLIVPVVRDADQKTFAQIEQDLAGYAGKAREGKIQIEDLQGGVFTISNGGVYGSLLSTPILNPPQSGILGMHTIQPRPMAVDGQVVVRPMMYLALSYDHRVVDGKDAVTFLVRLKENIEEPARLLLQM